VGTSARPCTRERSHPSRPGSAARSGNRNDGYGSGGEYAQDYYDVRRRVLQETQQA
jgi:hypothetical protein